MAKALGWVNWWGFSPSLDFQSFLSKDGGGKAAAGAAGEASGEGEVLPPLNILMVGAGDCRHVLKTFALSRQHPKREINVYVVENCLELIARHMLFWTLITEPQETCGLQDKADMFLELFGNSCIRAHTSQYLIDKSTQLIKMITDTDALKTRLPMMDVSELKFKERDELEAIFKFWRQPDRKYFEIAALWERRLREHYETRYDSRANLADWDYAMKLAPVAAFLHTHEFQRWRENGVAFSLRDAEYEVPNRTLASGRVLKGKDGRVEMRGYWGDTAIGPYLAYGTETNEETMKKKNNSQYIKMASDITYYNVTCLMYELITGHRYPRTLKSTEPGIEEEESAVKEPLQPLDKGAIPDGLRVRFLPLGIFDDFEKKKKYHGLFNMIYFSNSMVHLLKDPVRTIATPDATVIVESAKYMVMLNKEQEQEYIKKVRALAEAAGFPPVSAATATTDDNIVCAAKK